MSNLVGAYRPVKFLVVISTFLISAWNTLGVLIRHRLLVVEMAKRELTEQFAGQILGNIWVVFHPVFLMGVYLFIFGVVFVNRMGGTHEMPLDYTTYILSGLIPWLTMQQNLSKTCSSITANANLVKQVVFPIEVLPVKTVLASLLGQIISLSVIVVYVFFHYGKLPISYLLIPVLIVLQLIATIGIALLLSSVCVFIRDVKELITLYSVVGMFLLPVVFSNVPASIFKPILYINPFSYLIWCYQDVLYFGRIEHPLAWGVWGLGSIMLFAIGANLFRNLRQIFGDAL